MLFLAHLADPWATSKGSSGETALSLSLPGGHGTQEPAAPLSQHKLFTLGPSVNELVSTQLPNGKLGISKRSGAPGQ